MCHWIRGSGSCRFNSLTPVNHFEFFQPSSLSCVPARVKCQYCRPERGQMCVPQLETGVSTAFYTRGMCVSLACSRGQFSFCVYQDTVCASKVVLTSPGPWALVLQTERPTLQSRLLTKIYTYPFLKTLKQTHSRFCIEIPLPRITESELFIVK